jgi:CheY-like chemotaxis protein
MTAQSSLSQLSVLVVDDEPDSLDGVTGVLEFYGASVYNASNGKEAAELLETLKPDLILSDLSMPLMDGWALIAHIRQTPRLANIPVIALTAHAMTGDRQRGMNAGFTSYLTKPISALTLLSDLADSVPSLVRS